MIRLKDNMGASTLSADATVDMILNLQFVSSHEHKKPAMVYF